MHRAPTGRIRLGGGGFAPVPQDDAPDDCGDGDQGPVGEQQQRRWTPQDFRTQVRQVIRQSANLWEHDNRSVDSSPAFSDTTLIATDYLSVPTQHYDEVDLGNSGTFIEYNDGYYGPEPTRLSPTPSTKAGLGLEVHSRPIASSLSPGGLYVDDPLTNVSYLGSEGKTEEEMPSEPRNYKPPVLGGKILLALFFTLAALVLLGELAIQLLPSQLGVTSTSQEYDNTTEIRVRPRVADWNTQPSPLAYFRRQNDTNPAVPPPEPTPNVPTLTETAPGTIPPSLTLSSSTSSGTTTTSRVDETTPIPTVSNTVPTIVLPTEPPPGPQSSLTTSTSEVILPPTSSSTPPAPSTSSSVENTPPPTASSVESAPPSSISSTTPDPPPGGQVPTPPQDSSSSPATPTTTPPSITVTDSGTTTSDTGGPGPTSDHPGEPGHTSQPTEPDPPFTLPTYRPTSTVTDPQPPTLAPTDPPQTLPTVSDPTSVPTSPGTDPIITLPTEPPSSSAPSSITEPISIPTSTTISATTSYPDTISSGNDPTSTSPKPPAPPDSSATSTKVESSSSSASVDSSISTNITPTSSSSTSVYHTISSSESTTTTSHEAPPPQTARPTTPEPFATITRGPDEQPFPSPSTTTIVTSVRQGNGVFVETTIKRPIHHFDDSLTLYVTTYTDSNGRPTLTSTILAQMSEGPIVFTDANGKPTRTATGVVLRQPGKLTLTNFQGEATATEDFFLYSSTETLFDGAGHPTATRTSMVTEIANLTTLYDSNGVPTETRTEFIPYSPSKTTTVIMTPSSKAAPNSEGKALHIVPMSDGKYFVGLMLPTFIAIILSIPIRIIDQNAKLYQPFHALALPQGAQARDTLCFQTAGIWNIKERVNALLNGQILLTLTGLLLLASIVVIPLSSEAIHIALEGPDCAATKGDTLTCTMQLGVYSVPAQLTVILLVFMMVLVGAMILVLRKWKTGLNWNPWSLQHMGDLAANNEIRTLIRRRLKEKNGRITNRQTNRAFYGIPFVLDYWKDNGILKHSILVENNSQPSKTNGKSVTFGNGKHPRQHRANALPFFVLTWTGRFLFLALLITVEIGLLIYNIKGESRGYAQLMMGKWRVVRFIFTSIGVLISLFWGSFFYAVSFITPLKLLHRPRLYHSKAKHMTAPTNPYSALGSLLKPERRDLYLGVVSATAILSEILPLLITTALDESIESFWAHTVCLWMAVVILSIMIFTLCGSFFVAWPHMPIDPSTIVGAMYYALNTLIPLSPTSGFLFGRASPSLV